MKHGKLISILPALSLCRTAFADGADTPTRGEFVNALFPSKVFQRSLRRRE